MICVAVCACLLEKWRDRLKVFSISSKSIYYFPGFARMLGFSLSFFFFSLFYAQPLFNLPMSEMRSAGVQPWAAYDTQWTLGASACSSNTLLSWREGILAVSLCSKHHLTSKANKEWEIKLPLAGQWLNGNLSTEQRLCRSMVVANDGH